MKKFFLKQNASSKEIILNKIKEWVAKILGQHYFLEIDTVEGIKFLILFFLYPNFPIVYITYSYLKYFISGLYYFKISTFSLFSLINTLL
uniref:Uncharacterized protein n=1 Tax=Heterorhabditis bacteriophora TaxID=37862 RepID=A0A1I7WAJ3_HETBA